ncbi:MAG: DUF760 domain-containing protein [Prochloraceae cyanobacterium]|nr:DUF760 domain-containing protein [Prochloraceae cyanobacterium]
MNNPDNFVPRLSSQQEEIKALGNYVQSLPPEIIKRLSQPTPAAAAAMQESLAQMLGNLPSPDFKVTLTTSRESLGQLLASAMMNGYFLRQAEERMAIEKQLTSSGED